jgi:hypothetical protein
MHKDPTWQDPRKEINKIVKSDDYEGARAHLKIAMRRHEVMEANEMKKIQTQFRMTKHMTAKGRKKQSVTNKEEM